MTAPLSIEQGQALVDDTDITPETDFAGHGNTELATWWVLDGEVTTDWRNADWELRGLVIHEDAETTTWQVDEVFWHGHGRRPVDWREGPAVTAWMAGAA